MSARVGAGGAADRDGVLCAEGQRDTGLSLCLAITRCSDGLLFVYGVLACGQGATLLIATMLLAPC